jgi:hypothetical protein
VPEPAGEPRSGRRRRLTALGAALLLRAAPLSAVPILAVPLVAGVLLVGVAGPAAATGSAGPTPAAAASSTTPAASSTAPTAPTRLCQLVDPRLPELSGLVSAGDKLLAMDDGGSRLELYVLDTGCRVLDVRTAAIDPYDPEDLALGGDGTIWFADTGDNRASRATVALLAMHPDGTTTVQRLAYPDGPHDAEALLLAPDGTPYIVTKDITGVSGVYRPAAPLTAGGTTAMTRVATVRMTATGTPGGPVGPLGQLLVTGGAVSRDGRLIALRTYTDAYVWPLRGADVVTALAGTPRRIALPPEPQGEAVSFTEDDASLVVGGETVPSDIDLVPLPAAAATPAPGAAPAAAAHPGIPTLDAALIAVGVATVAVWLAGVLRRWRRRAGGPAA